MASVAATIAVLPAGSPAATKVQTGKYNCCVFYAPGTPTFVGAVTIKAHRKYRYYDRSTTSGGKFSCSHV